MMRQFLKIALQRQIMFTALRVSLVVGTILNLINQGSDLMAGTGISWGHLAMNYLVPYCVSTFSAAMNELSRRDPLA